MSMASSFACADEALFTASFFLLLHFLQLKFELVEGRAIFSLQQAY
jgi:hypothetical protein